MFQFRAIAFQRPKWGAIWRIAVLRGKHYILRILKPCLVKNVQFHVSGIKTLSYLFKIPMAEAEMQERKYEKKGTSVKVWDVLVRSSSV